MSGVWCGVVWCGVVWCVWCGVVWCVVWCGVVCGVWLVVCPLVTFGNKLTAWGYRLYSRVLLAPVLSKGSM